MLQVYREFGGGGHHPSPSFKAAVLQGTPSISYNRHLANEAGRVRFLRCLQVLEIFLRIVAVALAYANRTSTHFGYDRAVSLWFHDDSSGN
jgi:hypothetical protein